MLERENKKPTKNCLQTFIHNETSQYCEQNHDKNKVELDYISEILLSCVGALRN